MSRRRKIILLFCCGLLAIPAVLFFRRDREPSFRGRALSQWVVLYGNPPTTTVSQKTPVAADAIQHIGKPAVPHLLKWIEYDPSVARTIWMLRINDTIDWLRDKLNAGGDLEILHRNPDLGMATAKAFYLLKQHANIAVPELTKLLQESSRWRPTCNAASALAYLGEPGVPPLFNALKGTNPTVRIAAIYAVQHLGTNARPMVPFLIHILASDTASNESAITAATLGKLRIETDTVVPALTRLLSSTNLVTARFSAEALANLAPLARPAIPALTYLLNSSDQDLRIAATNALHAIDPKTFTNTPSAIIHN